MHSRSERDLDHTDRSLQAAFAEPKLCRDFIKFCLTFLVVFGLVTGCTMQNRHALQARNAVQARQSSKKLVSNCKQYWPQERSLQDAYAYCRIVYSWIQSIFIPCSAFQLIPIKSVIWKQFWSMFWLISFEAVYKRNSKILFR